MSDIFDSSMKTLPAELGAIRPGSQWCWEPLKIESRIYIQVEVVEQRAGRWYVLCQALRDGGGIKKGRLVWNELSRFIEAAVLIKPAE